MSAHEAAGYGARQLGYGQSPAILVVDFQRAFTDPAFELGRFEHVHRAVERTARLLAVARELGVPVIKCFTSYESLRDVPPWKVDAMYRDFFHGMPTTEPDPRLHDPDYDYTFSKTAASIFFQTPLTAYLARLRVDTVIVTGCTTSGCVRASVVDAFSHGLRPIIPEDCAGDGSEEAHRRNLHDMSLRYADVTDSDAVMAWLRGLKA
ncbi:MAG: isochorismatase family protein [Gammaproteobacteria bacterium]|jgi:maleamate amidohydrolase|nr:isochorismatase family protein [Gammaproteobacteria bacterium]